MSQQYPGTAGRPGAPQAHGSQANGPAGAQQGRADAGRREEGQRENDRWDDDRWDDDRWEDDRWEEGDGPRRGSPPWARQPGAPWPPPPPPPPPGGQGNPSRSRIQPVTAGVIAVIAALVVAVVVLFAVHGHLAAPSPAAGTGHAPVGGGAPAQGGGGGGAYSGGGGGGSHLFLGGQVAKVSGTSITLSAQGRDITAAITSATQFTGSVKSASGIKPGQQVMVVISGYGSAHQVAQSISDPPSAP